MKLQILTAVALLVSWNACKAALEPDFATDVKVEIKDENKLPVESTDVVLLFNHFQDSKTKKYEMKADADGVVKATDKIVASLMVTATKEGFYPLHYDRVVIRMDVDSKKIRSLDLPLIMRRVKSPASLYAKKVNLAIPQQDQPVGFDFELGDWVKPFGRGLNNDALFATHREYSGLKFEGETLEKIRKQNADASEDELKFTYGKWIGTLALSCPNAKEGIALVDKDYCLYSLLRMPHLAYETGYDATWKREENTYSPRNTKEGIGYFLRTRVKLDDKGEIVSANYGGAKQ